MFLVVANASFLLQGLFSLTVLNYGSFETPNYVCVCVCVCVYPHVYVYIYNIYSVYVYLCMCD